MNLPLKYVLIGLLIMGDLYMCVQGISNTHRSFQKERHCGTVLHKSEQLRYSKHASTNHTFLSVQFDNGTIQDIDVSTHTYLTNNIGAPVCFNLRCDLKTGWFDILCIVMAFITISLTCAFIIIWIGTFFPDNRY